MRRVLVTGANGFIGRHLCRHLLESGWEVKGAVRRPDALQELPAGVTGILVGELSAQTDWSPALKDIKVVVHLAARVHVMDEDKNAHEALRAYRRVNVEGTRRLVESCACAGVRRLVFVSSVGVVGKGFLSAQRPYLETDPVHPVNPYSISKMEAEQVVVAAVREKPLEVVILRPPLVYGPGVPGNFLRLLQALDRGLPIPIATTGNARSMVFVGNLVDVIRLAMDHPLAAGAVFFVADAESLSTQDLVRRLYKHLGRRPRIVPVPVGLLVLLASCLGRRSDVDRLIGSLVVDTARVRDVLGWEPPFSVDHGLAETVRWFRGDPGGAGAAAGSRE